MVIILSVSEPHRLLEHADAIWASQWTSRDTVVSISADGAIIQWDAQSGQQLHAPSPHTLGLVSLSVSEAGDRAIYNSIEGLTRLWDLVDGALLSAHESFAKHSTSTPPSEPGVCLLRLPLTAPLTVLPSSMGYFSASKRRDLRFDWKRRKCYHPLRRAGRFW